jgi:DHA2 family multidrug resistance protein
MSLTPIVLPANMIALGSLPQDTMKNATVLYNLMRDLGGTIGGTVMNVPLHFHWNQLIEDINPARAGVQQFLDAQMSRFDLLIAGDPHRAAIKLLANLTKRRRWS